MHVYHFSSLRSVVCNVALLIHDVVTNLFYFLFYPIPTLPFFTNFDIRNLTNHSLDISCILDKLTIEYDVP